MDHKNLIAIDTHTHLEVSCRNPFDNYGEEYDRARITNEEIADAAAANSDIMIAFGSIDPHKGKMSGREARRLVENHGVKGFKFHPTVQGFLPADKMAWPIYFAPQLVQYANTLLKDRILFGSDYPLITPDRWLEDVEEAGFKNSVKPLILKENAMRLLGLK